MFLENCIILENRALGFGNYLLKIKSSESVLHTKAGQFYMLKSKNESLILRRPISLHYADKENKILEFYYEKKGKGTESFANLKPSDTIDIQGPLGHGFTTDIKEKNLLVIGGGMGIAPMKLLIEELQNNNNKVTFIAGGRMGVQVKILENMNLQEVTTHIMTDDGSLGERGNVVDKLLELLETKSFDKVFTCGPHKMMEAIHTVTATKNIPLEVSLEERMACGMKACVGCSIKTKAGMKKVCYDGPVFDADEILDVEPIINKDEVTVCCN